MFVFFLFAPGTLDAFLSSSWYFPTEGREEGEEQRSGTKLLGDSDSRLVQSRIWRIFNAILGIRPFC